jgi:glycerol-3-phosphate acyltransferase PlsY
VPVAAVIEVALWGVIVKLTKTASIGSLVIMVITIPFLMWLGVEGASLVWVALIIALIVWRHRGNIQRMVGGREHKVTT